MKPKILILEQTGGPAMDDRVLVAVYLKPTPEELADMKQRYPEYAEEIQRQYDNLEE